MNQLERLPAELHALVAQHLDPADALSARLTSRVLSVLAALAVRRLRSTNADLPAEAWSVFTSAIGLVLKLEGLSDLAALLSTLPGRLEDIEILVGRWSEAAGASYNSFLEQLLAHPCAPRLKRLVEQRSLIEEHIGVLPEVAEALLAGLPSLERCSLSVFYPIGREGRGSVKVARFPAQLQQLSLYSTTCRVDVAGLAACSGLTSLELRLYENCPDNLPNAIAACQQLRSLTVQVYLSPQQQEDLLAAASATLTQLRSLSLPYSCPSPQMWQQLAQGLPSLQELRLPQLRLAPGLSAAPGITSLSAGLTWLEENEDSRTSLAAVLPALRALNTNYYNWAVHLTVLTQALWGHAQLAELKVWSMGITPQAPWPPQDLLSSLPQLRRLVLLQPPCASLDALLADAAGCARLEELEVRISSGFREYDGEPEPLTGAGLAALAAGACSDSLRRVVLETQLSEHMRLIVDEELDQLPERPECFSPVSVAALLRPGALPRLRELELDVALPPPPPGRSKQQLEGAEAYIVRRVEAELGARPAEGFAVIREPTPPHGTCLHLPVGLSLRGAVGECVATLNVCLSSADWALLGLSPASAGL
jgi:hypothetical protein